MKQSARIAAAVVTVAGAWLWAQPVFACKCMLLEPKEAADQASAVFEGRVVEVSVAPGTPMPRKQVTLRVVRVWKGMQTEQAVLTTASESAACGIEFAKDQNYVVYASMQDGALSANSCSRTRLLAEADEDVKVLGMGWTPVDPKGGQPAAPDKDKEKDKDEAKDSPSATPAAQAQAAANPSEPPARGGCASCAVGHAPGITVGAFAWLVPALWLMRRRARG